MAFDGGTGTELDPYLISTAEQLREIETTAPVVADWGSTPSTLTSADSFVVKFVKQTKYSYYDLLYIGYTETTAGVPTYGIRKHDFATGVSTVFATFDEEIMEATISTISSLSLYVKTVSGKLYHIVLSTGIKTLKWTPGGGGYLTDANYSGLFSNTSGYLFAKKDNGDGTHTLVKWNSTSLYWEQLLNFPTTLSVAFLEIDTYSSPVLLKVITTTGALYEHNLTSNIFIGLKAATLGTYTNLTGTQLVSDYDVYAATDTGALIKYVKAASAWAEVIAPPAGGANIRFIRLDTEYFGYQETASTAFPQDNLLFRADIVNGAWIPLIGDLTTEIPAGVRFHLTENRACFLANDGTFLLAQRYKTSAYFKQTANIDLSGYANWTPIGYFPSHKFFRKNPYAFTGSFDGQSFVISNLTINKPNREGIGLFGAAKNATFKNVVLENVNIEIYYYTYATGYKAGQEVGALVGYIEDGKIENCSSTGVINCYGGNYVGGLVGWAEQMIKIDPFPITDSWSTVAINSLFYAPSPVSSGLWNGGGFIGYVEGKNAEYTGVENPNCIRISNCYATGNLLMVDAVEDTSWYGNLENCGGFVGEVWGGIFDTCYATGNVKGLNGLGGFVGQGDEYYFRNCYATGDVLFCYEFMARKGSVESSYGYFGGFGGCMYYSLGVFINCYAAGAAPVGAFFRTAGFQPYETRTVTRCYYDHDVSPITDPLATPKTTAEMKDAATFTDWDFVTVWGISAGLNESYPTFVYLIPVIVYYNAAHYIKQNGHWVAVTDVETVTTTDIGDFETAVNALIETALTAALGGSY